jgi:hypothetical protein
MQFNVKDWRRYYDRVKRLGQFYKDAQYDYKGNPPKRPLSLEAQLKLKDEIKELIEKCKRYMDACHMKAIVPLWHYTMEDKRTWPSHESFAYGHLLTFSGE